MGWVMRQVMAFIILTAFITNSFVPLAHAQKLPIVSTSGVISTPAHLTGMVVDLQDPFRLSFIADPGDMVRSASVRKEYERLIKYFLASLAIPEKDQWVNLSPYEKDRIIPDGFGLTVMGRDLLAQDYLLKQITSNMIRPDTVLGNGFWDKVYALALDKFGTTDVPTDVFNKVWIIPDRAVIYEKNNAVYVLEHHLKVMLDSDYLAMKNNAMLTRGHGSAGDVSPSTLPGELALDTNPTEGVNRAPVTDDMVKDIMRQVIIPALEKEVNEGGGFALLRQIYGGMLLATWYKRALKNSLLGQIYGDRSKVKGLDHDPAENQKIYEQYVAAFRQGAFNMIKEDVDALTQEVVPRQYFSGGLMNAHGLLFDEGKVVRVGGLPLDAAQGQEVVSVRLVAPKKDAAQSRAGEALAKAIGPLALGDPWERARLQLGRLALDRPPVVAAFQERLKLGLKAEWASSAERYIRERKRKTLVLKKIGAMSRMSGDTLYYPFAGGDADEPFLLSSEVRNVMAMGQEPFGSMEQMKEFLERGSFADQVGKRNRDGYDHGGRLEKTGAVAGLALARIMVTLRAQVLGIKYFDIDGEGNIHFRDVEKDGGKNAVVVFKGNDGQVRTFWYCQYEVTSFVRDLIRPDPFRRMVNRMSFQTMLVKAAQSFLFEGVKGLDTATVVHAPAYRNDARVLTDSRFDHYADPIYRRDTPQPVFAVKPASVAWWARFKFGYGNKVFWGRARAVLADAWGAPLDVWKSRPYVPDIMLDPLEKLEYAPVKRVNDVLISQLKEAFCYEIRNQAVSVRTSPGNMIEIVGWDGLKVQKENVFDLEVWTREKLVKVYYVDNKEWREGRIDLNTGAFSSKSLWDVLAPVDAAQSRTAWDPLHRAKEFLQDRALVMPGALAQWQDAVLDSQGLLAATMRQVRKGNRVYAAKLLQAGRRMQMPDGVLYYPFGGVDAADPFMLSAGITDVVSMGGEGFGRITEIEQFFDKGNAFARRNDLSHPLQELSDHLGLRRGDYDSVSGFWNSRKEKKGWDGFGRTALARIMTFMDGRIDGIAYFRLDKNGDIRFVDPHSPEAGGSAVIVFHDAKGVERRYWYIQHHVLPSVESMASLVPFDMFMREFSFQTLLIKAAQSWLFEGVYGLNVYKIVQGPARRNGALVVTDTRLPDHGLGLGWGSPQPVFVQGPRSVDMGERYRFGYGRFVFFAHADHLRRVDENPFFVVGGQLYRPFLVVDGVRQHVDQDYYEEHGGFLIQNMDHMLAIHAGDMRFSVMGDNRVVLRNGPVIVQAWDHVTDVHVDARDKTVRVYYFDSQQGWQEACVDLANNGVVTREISVWKMVSSEGEKSRVLFSGDENGAMAPRRLDPDLALQLAALYGNPSRPLAEVEGQLRALFPQAGISLTQNGFYFNREKVSAPDELLSMTMKYLRNYRLGGKLFTVADFNTGEEELARENIINAETPSEISEKSYYALKDLEKDSIFEALAQRIQGGRMLHVDHHYGYPVLARVSTAPMLLDFVRYLQAKGRHDVIRRLKETFIFADHTDVDIMLANFVLRQADQDEYLEAHREAIVNAVSMNDYALNQGSRAGVILYHILVSLGEEAKLKGFDEGKEMAFIKAALVFADQHAGKGDLGLYALAQELRTPQNALVMDYFLRGMERFLRASAQFERMLAASSGHMHERGVQSGQMRIMDKVLFCYVQEGAPELDNTDIVRFLSSSRYKGISQELLAIVTTNPVVGEVGARRFKLRSVVRGDGSFFDFSPDFWDALRTATADYGTDPGGRSMGGGLGKEALKGLVPEDVGRIAGAISSLISQQAQQRDAAMTKGGIDLGGADLDMIIRRDGNGMLLPFDRQDIGRLQVEGLVPEILEIRPAASSPIFNQASLR